MTKKDFLQILPFLLIILTLDISSMYHMSLTTDEGGHLYFGKSVLERQTMGRAMQKMPVTLLNYLPAHLLDKFHADVSPKTVIFLCRLPSVLVSLVLATLIFVWSKQLYGSAGALLSLTLYALCPNVLAHSRVATTDIYCACLMFASTILFLRYLNAPRLSSLVQCSIVMGLAQITKHTALLLFPLFVVIWAVHALRPSVPRLPAIRIGVHLVAAVIMVLLAMNTAYLFRGTLVPVREYLQEYRLESPDLKENPTLKSVASLAAHFPSLLVPLPQAYLRALFHGISYNATGQGHGPIYLLGNLSQKGWWYYFLRSLCLEDASGIASTSRRGGSGFARLGP